MSWSCVWGTLLCLGRVSVQTFFIYFIVLKLFLLIVISHHWNFPDASHRKLHPVSQ